MNVISVIAYVYMTVFCLTPNECALLLFCVKSQALYEIIRIDLDCLQTLSVVPLLCFWTP